MYRPIAIALVVALAVAAPAEAKRKRHKPTKVAVTGWVVTVVPSATGVAQERNAAVGSTFTHCASEQLRGLRVTEKITRARKDDSFKEYWTASGTVRDLFHKRWTRAGTFTSSSGINNASGLPDGAWSFKLTHSGHTWVNAALTIATNPAC
jgi:hypothetical protein